MKEWEPFDGGGCIIGAMILLDLLFRWLHRTVRNREIRDQQRLELTRRGIVAELQND